MSQSLSGPERFITLFAWDHNPFQMVCFNVVFNVVTLAFFSANSANICSPLSVDWKFVFIALTLSSSSLRLAAPAPCHLATCTLPALAPSQVPGCWIFSTKAEVGGGKVAKLPSNKIFNCARCCCTLMAHCKSIANTLCSAKFSHLHMCTQFKQQPTAHRILKSAPLYIVVCTLVLLCTILPQS